METTTITLHTKFQIDKVDPRIFGGFLEHMGRAVYEGVYDPDCVRADEDGFRTDVMAALRRLNMPGMRYPGGNFVSGYHWMDGVGPREQRPRRKEPAWKSVETNQFGTDEFCKLCRKMRWEPMMAVNLGTGTAEEARNWVEYCNGPTGTEYGDMRAAHNGTHEPYGVKLWFLGNEMDGDWQQGHVPADQYAARATEAAKAMREVDESIELVTCGSCNPYLPTYMEWDQQVLQGTGDLTDYLSLHRYVGNSDSDTPDFLAVTNAIDRQIEEMDAVCRFIQAKRRSKKRTCLSFDEWNVWYKNMEMDGNGQTAPHLIEEVYNLEDALVVAGFLSSFIRHADVVKIANIAQIVNVIAPILTRGDDMLIQSIFYPFEMFSRRREGVSLRLVVDGPTYEGKSNGLVHTIDTSAILNDDKLHVFATNRSLDESASVHVQLADGDITTLDSAELLTGPDAKAANSFEQPDVVVSRSFADAGVDVRIVEGEASLELPPLSVAAMTFNIG
ncbi:MAG: alpha-L-arabinofuranosidase C-terminal domain-containing protein [Anaerolineae bacterium]